MLDLLKNNEIGKWLACSAILACVTLLLFWPSLHFGFLGWDDIEYIHQDPAVLKGLHLEGIRYAFSKFNLPYFMPLTRISYMADVSLYGIEQPWGFHLTNTVIHILVSLLLMVWLNQFVRNHLIALAGALLFALHPQHVEAVVWIAGRKELLAGLFGMAALLSYSSYVKSGNKIGYLGTIVLFACSLMSKPIWMSMPVLLLVLDFFPFRRLDAQTWRSCVKEKVPLLIVAAGYVAIFNLAIYVEGGNFSYYPNEPFYKRIWLPILGLGYYISNTLWPINLLPYYPFPDKVPVDKAMLWAMVIVFLVAAAWQMRKTYVEFLMMTLWFGLSLAAALKITLFPFGEAMFIGDRYTYLPHIGVALGVTLLLEKIAMKTAQHRRYAIFFIFAMVVCACFWQSKQVLKKWESPLKLWSYTAEHLQGKGQAYPLLMQGRELQLQGKNDEALMRYKQSYEAYPEEFFTAYHVIQQLWQQGKKVEAMEWEEKLLVDIDKPAPAKLLFSVGGMASMAGDYERAERFLLKAQARNEQGKNWIPDIDVFLVRAQLHNGHYSSALQTMKKLSISLEDRRVLCNVKTLHAIPQDISESDSQKEIRALLCKLER